MGRFDATIKLAQRLIAKNGEVATLRSVVPSAGDPSMPWRPGPSTDSDQQVVAVFLNYDQRYIDGAAILRGDQQVFIPADGLSDPPQIGGMVLRSDVAWNIVDSKPLNPNGQTILYELQVRQ